MPGLVRGAPPPPIATAFEERYPRTPRRSILGRGAFGVVFAVTAPGDESRRYVAKEIGMSSVSPKKQRAALVESALLRSLSHPNIVGCVDALLLDNNLYIVMEYATGGDLAQRIRAQRDIDERFPERTVMTVFAQCAAALRFVHHRKILHRDIKPANLFICGSGELDQSVVKLGDFGLGKMFEGTTFEANTMVGSPSYFSPEVCKGKPYGRKSDVWSLGVVLFEMASLSVPFLAKTIIAAAVMICKSDIPALPSEYSCKLGDLVGRMLQKEPATRPSISTILQEPFVQQFVAPVRQEETGGCEVAQAHANSADKAVLTDDSMTNSRGSDQVSSQEIDAELVRSQSRASAVDAIKQAFRTHEKNELGTVSSAVLAQLLVLVVPGMTQAAASQVLEAAGCRCRADAGEPNDAAETVDFGAFVEWLCSA